MDHQIPARRSNLVVSERKKRTYRLVNFDYTVGQKRYIKENEMIDKYLDVSRE